MSFHEGIIEYLQETSVLGNTLFDYTVALAIFVLSFLVLEVFRFLLTNKLSKMEKLQKNRYSSILILTLKNYFSITLSIILAVYASTRYLDFPPVFARLIEGLVFGMIAWLVLKLGLNLLNAVVEYQRSLENRSIHILEFFRIIVRAVLIVVITIWFLTSIEVDVTSFIASLGILSLAIAFSLKEVLADIFASIVIFIDKPFEIGDAIKVDNDSGTVEKIGIRSTKIRSSEGHIIVASNRELTNKKIHNLKRMDERRITITLQIHQATPVSLLNQVPEIVREVVTEFDNLRFDRINLKSIGDYSYDYEMVYFVLTRDFRTHAEAKHNILISLLEKFEETDIMMPYPTQTIILEE